MSKAIMTDEQINLMVETVKAAEEIAAVMNISVSESMRLMLIAGRTFSGLADKGKVTPTLLKDLASLKTGTKQ